MCSNFDDVSSPAFKEATERVKRAQKIEKFFLWFLVVPAILGFIISVAANSYFESHPEKSFYSQNVKFTQHFMKK